MMYNNPMGTKLIKTICKTTDPKTGEALGCGAAIVQDGKRSMKRCAKCGEKWNFTIRIDGKPHLFHAKPKKDKSIKAKIISASAYPHEIARARKAGYGDTELWHVGYEVAVLGLTRGRK